jgi:hypothetical protein
MEFNIDAFPGAIYLSKSMTIRSLLFFRVARRFGHRIVAWDEEALVHLPADVAQALVVLGLEDQVQRLGVVGKGGCGHTAFRS